MSRQIKTICIYPPIPDRRFDWCAFYEGEEEAGNYGYGRTEAEAIADFIENCAEEPEVDATAMRAVEGVA